MLCFLKTLCRRDTALFKTFNFLVLTVAFNSSIQYLYIWNGTHVQRSLGYLAFLTNTAIAAFSIKLSH